MNKIGWGQLALVLVTSRVFSEATTISETNIQYGMQRYSVVILSFLLTAAAYIPLYILSKRFPEKGVIGAIGEKSPVTAKILGILLEQRQRQTQKQILKLILSQQLNFLSIFADRIVSG